jgi:FAD/FMN-containing dehydrogenase
MLTDLRDGRAGTALYPGDDGWGANPPAYVPPGDPALEVLPETEEQVAEALRFAAAEGVGVAIRSGGHGGRLFDQDGGLVLNMKNFAGIAVDGTTVRVGPAAIWGDVALALAEHGLGLSSGDTKSVGVGGLALGGGVGWLVRTQGLAMDSLIGATVVVPGGEILRASADENPDLFWGLHGGGGNFGVVTELVFQAHPLDGVVFGHVHFETGKLGDALRGWRDVMRDAPDELNGSFLAMPSMAPEMPAATMLTVIWAGRDAAAAEPWIARLREIPGYVSDDVAPIDYPDSLDEAPPHMDGPAPTIVGANAFVDDFSDAAIDALMQAHAGVGGVFMVRYLGGAYGRIPADATAWAAREAEAFVMVAGFLPPGAERAAQDAVRAKWAPALPFVHGTYGNFADDIGEAVIALMYPPATLERLREMKRRYDPQNLLSRNQNIVP